MIAFDHIYFAHSIIPVSSLEARSQPAPCPYSAYFIVVPGGVIVHGMLIPEGFLISTLDSMLGQEEVLS